LDDLLFYHIDSLFGVVSDGYLKLGFCLFFVVSFGVWWSAASFHLELASFCFFFIELQIDISLFMICLVLYILGHYETQMEVSLNCQLLFFIFNLTGMILLTIFSVEVFLCHYFIIKISFSVNCTWIYSIITFKKSIRCCKDHKSYFG